MNEGTHEECPYGDVPAFAPMPFSPSSFLFFLSSFPHVDS